MERAGLASQLNGVLEDASAGKNVVAVISGSTGMGKSTLLRNFSERATADGVTVLSATSLRGEQKVPYGTLGKLFDSMGQTILPALRIGAEPHAARQDFIHVARATFQAVSELAEYGTVVIAVDDVQFIDIESLRCLQYLEQGLRGRPLAIVFTWEPQLDQAPLPMLEDFVYRPDVRRIRLNSLSQDGVAEMIAGHVGTHVGESEAADLARVYHQVSGGNPLLVNAMLAESPSGTYPVAQDDSAGLRFREAILVCVHRLGPLAIRVASGIAVLRDSSNMPVLSRLIDEHVAVTRRVVEKLTATGVLDSNGFRHEAVQAAILADIPADEAVELRYRAAQLLHEEGVPSRVVADQLLEADPFPQDWVLPILRDAAECAVENDTMRAIKYLRFAAECCTDQNQRYSLKTQVAALYWLIDPASSGSRLLSLKAPALAGKIEGDDAVRVAELLLWNLRFDDAVEVINNIDGPARRLVRLFTATNYPGLLRRAEMSTEDDSLAPAIYSPELQAAESLAAVLAQTADEHTIAQAEQVLQDAGRTPDALRVVEPAILALIYSDLLDTAASWCERFTAELNGPVGASMIAGFNALVSLRTGQLGAAVEQAEVALELMADHSWTANALLALATLAEAHTASGDHDAAAQLFARPVSPELLQTRAGLHYLYARGRHHLANDRAPAALADFMACGERMTAWNIDSAGLAPWRVGAADAWLAMGDRERAAHFVSQQVELLGPDLFRARGMTLRRQAAVQPTDQRLETLQSALQMLQIGNDRYESAHVLADMSEIYQQLGDKAYARTVARRARRIAKSCNAEDLCQKLLTTYFPGMKPQRRRQVPKDDYFAILSDSERRVAALAALGYSNREIAEKLYVTVSTIEQHLTRVYRKLSIRNREELPMDVGADAAEIA